MASVSVLECIRGCWRSVRHIIDRQELLSLRLIQVIYYFRNECHLQNGFINFKFSFNFKLLPLEKNMWQLQLEESFFPFFYPPPPPPAALSFQNKGREKHNLIPCGNVMQLENREGITATLYNIKKSDGLFWFSMLEKTHWCLTFISAVYPPYKAL